MPRPVHFEIHTDDPARAVKFYKDVFAWDFQKWDGPEEYYLVTTGKDSEPGINGGLLKRKGKIDGTAVIAYVCTVDVPSVDEYGAKVEKSGGKIVVPKTAITGMGWVTYAKDTEGNIFGLYQNDKNAK